MYFIDEFWSKSELLSFDIRIKYKIMLKIFV